MYSALFSDRPTRRSVVMRVRPTRAGSRWIGSPLPLVAATSRSQIDLGGLDRDLLTDNRAGQRRERIAAPHHVDPRIIGDEPRHDDVLFRQRAGRLVPVRRLHAGPNGRGWSVGWLWTVVGNATSAEHFGEERWYITPPSVQGATESPRFGLAAREAAALGPCRRGLASLRRLRASPRAADPNKVLRIAFPTGETGFDPVKVFDLYSNTVNEAIFERLLTYDYLARPAKLVPMAAEAMPEVAENGRTYTFQITQGHLFHARSRVQGREARARRAGFRLFVQALHGSEESLAVRVPDRGQDRGPG